MITPVKKIQFAGEVVLANISLELAELFCRVGKKGTIKPLSTITAGEHQDALVFLNKTFIAGNKPFEINSKIEWAKGKAKYSDYFEKKFAYPFVRCLLTFKKSLRQELPLLEFNPLDYQEVSAKNLATALFTSHDDFDSWGDNGFERFKVESVDFDLNYHWDMSRNWVLYNIYSAGYRIVQMFKKKEYEELMAHYTDEVTNLFSENKITEIQVESYLKTLTTMEKILTRYRSTTFENEKFVCEKKFLQLSEPINKTLNIIINE